MKRSILSLLPVALAVLTAGGAQGAGAPAPDDGRPLLERVAAAYRGFRSFRFEGMVRLDLSMPDESRTIEMPIRMAGVNPGRRRIEMRNPMLSLVRASDGDTTWTWVPQLDQYTRQRAAPAPVDSAGDDPFAAGTPLVRYLAMTRGLRSSRITGAATLPLDGRAVACTMVEADYEPTPGAQSSPTTFWIDPLRSVVLRESVEVRMDAETGRGTGMKQVTTYDLVRVEEPLPDTLFRLRPPDSAELVPSLSIPGLMPADPVGETAPDLTLDDLKGRPVSLTSLRGKVVLLQFRAGWCAPCRDLLPAVAKLEAEMKARGLAVVDVSVGETVAGAAADARRNHRTGTVLVDLHGTTVRRFGAVGLPTVMIVDRAGTIAGFFAGVASEAELRAALGRAGLE